MGAPETSRQLLTVLATAAKQAREMADEYVSTEHLLVGLAADGGQAATILREAGATGTGCWPCSSRSAGTPG